MNIKEFHARHGLKAYGTVANSWDAFGSTGVVLMQLWQAPKQRVREHAIPGAYLRVRCFDAAHSEANGQRQAVGYAGRHKSIEAIKQGAKGFAALSAPPTEVEHGPGVWAKYADLQRVFPILGIESAGNGDIFAILGAGVPASQMTAA